MKKKKQNGVNQPVEQPVQAQNVAGNAAGYAPNATPSTTAFPLCDMQPSQELQIYYNDAYMREKQRFNDMFGIIEKPEEPQPEQNAEPSVPVSEVEQNYVPVEEYNKVCKKRRGLGAGLAIAITIAVIAIILFLTNSTLL